MRYIILIVLFLTTFLSYSMDNKMSNLPKCEECSNIGYVTKYDICPLCRGFGDVSPKWFDKNTSSVRWTERTWLLTGNKENINFRYKKNSFFRCPLCSRSSKRGTIKTISRCKNGCSLDNKDVESCVTKLKNIVRRINLRRIKDMETEIKDMLNNSINNCDDFSIVRICKEMKSWSLQDVNKDSEQISYIKLLSQSLNNNYDLKSAHYLRNVLKGELKDLYDVE